MPDIACTPEEVTYPCLGMGFSSMLSSDRRPIHAFLSDNSCKQRLVLTIVNYRTKALKRKWKDLNLHKDETNWWDSSIIQAKRTLIMLLRQHCSICMLLFDQSSFFCLGFQQNKIKTRWSYFCYTIYRALVKAV